MALVDVGKVFYPPLPSLNTAGSGSHLLNASGHYSAVLFRASKAGNLRKFAAPLSAITDAPDNGLRFGFRPILGTGLPDMTTLNASATIASGSLTTGWNDPGNFDTTVAVVKNQLVAAVIDFPTFVAGDSVSVRTFPAVMGIHAHPYAVLNGAKSSDGIAMAAIEYDDGEYMKLLDPVYWPFQSMTVVTFQDSTNPDEYGFAVTPPFPCRCIGVYFSQVDIDAAGALDVKLYIGTSQQRVCAVADTDQMGSNAARIQEFPFDDGSIDLSAGTEYRVGMKATSSTINIVHGTLNSSAIVSALVGGNSFYMNTRNNAGSWTSYNNVTDGYRRLSAGLILSHLDNGAGGAGVNRAALPSGLSALG